MQRGMWFHAQSIPGRGVDTQQIVIEFREELDVERFVACWRTALARHDILRSYFPVDASGEPVQCFADDLDLPVSEVDWSDRSDGELEAAFVEFLGSDRLLGFDLEAPPLMRLTFVRVREAEIRCVWTFHHIQLDGRSYTSLLEEVLEGYDRGEDRTGRAPEPAASYRDYLQWIHSRRVEASDEHWRSLLADFDAPTPLPFAKSGDLPTVAIAHADHEARLSSRATRALGECARFHEVTVNTLVQAAWGLTLHHTTGEDDVVFAATRACRRGFDGLETMVGVFINTLPVRSRLNPDTSLGDYLRALRAQALEVRPHEHTPLTRVQELSEVQAGHPLFHSLVVFENSNLDAALKARHPGWTQRRFSYRGQTNFPLTLMAYNEDELVLRLEYDSACFEAERVRQLAAYLTTLLENLPRNRETRALDVPVLPVEESERLLDGWNPAYTSPPSALVHERMAARARARPNEVAVRFEAQELTYGELLERSESLASRLADAGAGPGGLAGVCLERSLHTPVALLAVMQTGAAYVPLDPRYPRERLDHIVRDSDLALVITEEAVADRLPRLAVQRIDIDHGLTQPNALPRGPLPSSASPNDRAYVIYTSGSTGLPKGVEVPHRGLSNFLAAMEREPGLSEEDTLVAVTTVSFDIAALELFLPLCVGGCVVIASDRVAADGRALGELLDRSGATALQATPATWRLLLDAGWRGRGGLKMLCGGEALPPDLADFLLETGGELWNMYGPTETTIWSSVSRVEAGAAITIGRPIANTSFYILDEAMRPVPMGAVGELFIGGLGVTRGYLNQASLTKERFLPNPFREGDRIYRTGDLARYLEDGRVECLGRTDHQVKIRGFRIELGEIESALQSHDGVDAAVVVAQSTPAGTQQLVGYVTASGNTAPSVSELRKFTQTKLPDYMVPATFLALPSLPLTDNGKIDRKALPRLEGDRPELESVFVPPKSPLERQIASIWQELLLVERIGIHDDFFDLGGDSILVVRVLRQLRDRLGAELAAHELFTRRTIQGLALCIGEEEVPDFVPALNEEIEWRASQRRAAISRSRARHRKLADRGPAEL